MTEELSSEYLKNWVARKYRALWATDRILALSHRLSLTALENIDKNRKRDAKTTFPEILLLEENWLC